MERVGAYLKNYVIYSRSDEDIDIFARSAFNRYYYACYLEIREMLKELKPEWKSLKHASIPDHLTTSVRQAPIKELRSMNQHNLLDMGKFSRLKRDLEFATQELADLLKRANDARKTADYQPEVPVYRYGDVVKLNVHTLSSADNWLSQVRRHIGVIKKIWKEAGLV